MLDIIFDTCLDIIKVLPFLFVAFLIIEFMEHKMNYSTSKMIKRAGRFGPLFGSFFGAIPQCGFSVLATNLYITRIITLGTLIAIYVSTSDEAIPILLVHPESFSVIVPIVATKVCIGIIAGYAVDLIFKSNLEKAPEKIEVCECGCCHNEIHSQVTNLFIHPLKHCFNVFIFILIVNCCLDFAFSFATNTMNNIFNVHSFLQIIFASIVGLIPNCATSVLIVMLYLKHVAVFGALIAGLTSNAGLGLLVLFQNNEDKKECLKIAAILLFVAIFVGFALQILI